MTVQSALLRACYAKWLALLLRFGHIVGMPAPRFRMQFFAQMLTNLVGGGLSLEEAWLTLENIHSRRVLRRSAFDRWISYCMYLSVFRWTNSSDVGASQGGACLRTKKSVPWK